MIPFSSFILTMFHNVKNPFIRYLSGFFPDLLYLDKIKQIDHAWSLFTSRINRDTVILNNRICLSYLRKRHMWELLEGEDRFLPGLPWSCPRRIRAAVIVDILIPSPINSITFLAMLVLGWKSKAFLSCFCAISFQTWEAIKKCMGDRFLNNTCTTNFAIFNNIKLCFGYPVTEFKWQNMKAGSCSCL